MSQHFSSDSIHTQSGNYDAFPKVEDPLYMINLSDLVMNIVPLTMVESIHEEASYTTSKKAKLSGKSLTSLCKMVPRKASRPQDILPHRRPTTTKTCVVLPEKHTGKWQYVNQIRISLEREL